MNIMNKGVFFFKTRMVRDFWDTLYVESWHNDEIWEDDLSFYIIQLTNLMVLLE